MKNTKPKARITRVEAVIVLRCAFNKFHMHHISDSDILNFMKTVHKDKDDHFAPLEEGINVKKDIFGEQNAKNILKLVKA